MKDYISSTANGLYWTKGATDKRRMALLFGNMLPILPADARILDLGCSVGWTTEEIAELYPGATVIGIDVNGERIRDANLMAKNARFLVADGYALPFADESFDAVFCANNVMFMLEELDRNGMLSKVFGGIERVAKPQGYFLLAPTGDGVGAMVRRKDRLREGLAGLARTELDVERRRNVLEFLNPGSIILSGKKPKSDGIYSSKPENYSLEGKLIGKLGRSDSSLENITLPDSNLFYTRSRIKRSDEVYFREKLAGQ